MTFARVGGLSLMLLLPLAVAAERTPGFSMSAFRAAVPGSATDAVFSPYAYEIDCAVIGEAFGPIEKARFVDSLGALIGLENVYRPIADVYRAGVTNDFTLVSGRAWLLPSLRLISPKYLTYLQSEYSVQACPYRPNPTGAECYLRAAMDGEMEDFRLEEAVTRGHEVSFVDLESLKVFWAEPFPVANTRSLAFTRADGSRREVRAMVDLRPAELWQTAQFTMLRLPMTGGASFYAVLPAEGVPLSVVRDYFVAERLNASLVILKSITESGIFHGPVAVVLPKFELDCRVDLSPAFTEARLPRGGLKEIFLSNTRPIANIWQRTRFVLDERGPGGVLMEKKPAAAETRVSSDTRKFICNRPFLFFVYHESSRTIPVAGVFAGGGK